MTQEHDPHPLLPLLLSATRQRMIIALLAVAAIFGLLYAIRDVATPVFAGLGLAYMAAPVVAVLERKLRLPRVVAVSALMVGVAVLGVGVIAVVVPTLVAQIGALAAKMPAYIAQGIEWIDQTFHIAIPTDAAQVLDRAKIYLGDVGPGTLSSAGAYVATFLAGSAGALGGIITLVLVPLFMFFFLKDWTSIRGRARTLLPAPMQEPIAAKLRQIDRSLSAYVRGVLTVATILAVIYSLSLSLLGVPLGLLIGVIAGYAYVVPFMSSAVGIGLGVLFSLLEFHGFGQVIGVFAIFIVGNIIEGLFLTPRIVGDSLGLSPMAVILAVMIGGNLFGFLGVMLALPAAAVLNVVSRDLLAAWRSSNFYTTGLGR
jgi:predicted PurR-regulated permease PerM